MESTQRMVSYKNVGSIKKQKAELHFFVEDLGEDDVVDITFPGNRNDKLVLRINGHVEHSGPLPRKIHKIKCDKQIKKIGANIVITVYKSNEESEWPSKDAQQWGL